MSASRIGMALDTLAVIGLDLPAPDLAKLRAAFPTVHYHPEATLPREVRGEIDMVFSNWKVRSYGPDTLLTSRRHSPSTSSSPSCPSSSTSS